MPYFKAHEHYKVKVSSFVNLEGNCYAISYDSAPLTSGTKSSNE